MLFYRSKVWRTCFDFPPLFGSMNQNVFRNIKAVPCSKARFPLTANFTTTTQKQSDYVFEQSSFPLIALFWLKIGHCRGRNWLYGNQA